MTSKGTHGFRVFLRYIKKKSPEVNTPDSLSMISWLF